MVSKMTRKTFWNKRVLQYSRCYFVRDLDAIPVMSQQQKKHSQIFPHQNKCIYITEEVHLFSVMLFGHPRLTFTTDSLIFFAV